jgi:hypothetical protein
MPDSIPAPNSSSFENKKNTTKWGTPKKYKGVFFFNFLLQSDGNFFDTHNFIFETYFKPVDFNI